jgi:beta-lactam-binding protein with PASTA domain
VPNIIERTEDAADKALVAAKLQAGKVTRLESGRLVTQQSPAAGATVACGSAVDFTVGTLRD